MLFRSVRAVSIPKKSGGQRILGVPTVADRVAQMVVKQVIEPNLAEVRHRTIKSNDFWDENATSLVFAIAAF